MYVESPGQGWVFFSDTEGMGVHAGILLGFAFKDMLYACACTLAHGCGQPEDSVLSPGIKHRLGLSTLAHWPFFWCGGDWLMCRLAANLELLIFLPAGITDVCHRTEPGLKWRGLLGVLGTSLGV